MKHLFSTKVKVVLVIALLLAAALTVVNSLTGLSLGEMTVQYVLTPLRTGASKLTDQAEQMYSYIFRYETLSAENEKSDVDALCDGLASGLKKLARIR